MDNRIALGVPAVQAAAMDCKCDKGGGLVQRINEAYAQRDALAKAVSHAAAAARDAELDALCVAIMSEAERVPLERLASSQGISVIRAHHSMYNESFHSNEDLWSVPHTKDALRRALNARLVPACGLLASSVKVVPRWRFLRPDDWEVWVTLQVAPRTF